MLRIVSTMRGRYVRLGAFCAMLAALAGTPAMSAGIKVLYSFKGHSDGKRPFAGLIDDAAGNMYGTTLGGNNSCTVNHTQPCGTVFKLATDGSETVLHAFTGGNDGSGPSAALVADSTGNLYGTTTFGGGSPKCNSGCGTVFKVAPDGTETVLHAFHYSDGSYPGGRLMMDQAGNLYGTTATGGSGLGTVFKIAPDGTESVLYAFTGRNDGIFPSAGLISDTAGNLYGTTESGGVADDGTVFRIAPDGSHTVLYSFQGGNDGMSPESDLIMDDAGNLYGATLFGGSADRGTVFKLSPDGSEAVLYAFQGGNDGTFPRTGVIADKAGNLYGTTENGGGGGCIGGCGTVFKLASDGTESVVATFGGDSGEGPDGGLLLVANDLLYGTCEAGGTYNKGVVFSVKK